MSASMPTFERILQKDHHTRRFAILSDDRGWRVTDRTDTAVLRDAVYTDWHRVERARRAFTIEMTTLRDEGWRESQ
jgi:hypothetical protein